MHYEHARIQSNTCCLETFLMERKEERKEGREGERKPDSLVCVQVEVNVVETEEEKAARQAAADEAEKSLHQAEQARLAALSGEEAEAAKARALAEAAKKEEVRGHLLVHLHPASRYCPHSTRYIPPESPSSSLPLALRVFLLAACCMLHAACVC